VYVLPSSLDEKRLRSKTVHPHRAVGNERAMRATHQLFFSYSVVQILAGQTGLEPATSAVTGRCSNQLNYWPSNSGALDSIDKQSTPSSFFLIFVGEWVAALVLDPGGYE
jgi:hypothetical protein